MSKGTATYDSTDLTETRKERTIDTVQPDLMSLKGEASESIKLLVDSALDSKLPLIVPSTSSSVDVVYKGIETTNSLGARYDISFSSNI